MSRRDPVLTKHRRAIRQVAARRKADAISLVGSVARGDDSDYDFLAHFIAGASLIGLAGLKMDLQELLGQEVDVISVGGLKGKHRGMLDEAIEL